MSIQPTNSKTPATGRAHWIDPATLMRIQNLQLRAKAVVDGFYNGLHRSPLHGFSVEFSEYRPYTIGEDPKNIDWKLFARSDRYFIKKFEDETNRRCYLVVDQSRSMSYTTIGYAKAEYARTLAATLAYYLHLQRDAVGLLTFEAKVKDFVAARHRPGQLQRILSGLDQPLEGKSTDLLTPLSQLADLVRQRSLMLIISDLMVPVDQLSSRFGYLRARRHEVMVMRVLDPGELELNVDRPLMLIDSETGKEVFIDPATAVRQYRQRFLDHEQQLKDMFGSHGIEFATFVTDQPLELALFDLLSAQQQRGGFNRRATRAVKAGGQGGAAWAS